MDERSSGRQRGPHRSDRSDPTIHKDYLQKGLLGYEAFSETDDGAYLLVSRYAPPEEELQTTLFLITHTQWFRRSSGGWHEVDDDQIVGDQGEFDGSLISPNLENLAVDWWDSLTSPPSFNEALRYCAAFPEFRFEFDDAGQLVDLVLETENGTWSTDGPNWKQRPTTAPAVIERLQNIEELVVRSNPTASSSHSSSSSNLDTAMSLGLLSKVHPTLASEGHAWFIKQGSHDDTSGIGAFLTTFMSASLMINSDTFYALIIRTRGSIWIRENNQWIIANHNDTATFKRYRESVNVHMDRVSEIAAWWDHRSIDNPRVETIPENYDRANMLASNSRHRVPSLKHGGDCRLSDGQRIWSWQRNKWAVRPERYCAHEDEPWFDERLPDWFYNA